MSVVRLRGDALTPAPLPEGEGIRQKTTSGHNRAYAIRGTLNLNLLAADRLDLC